jgi:uncharacterized protein (DUF305 family)
MQKNNKKRNIYIVAFVALVVLLGGGAFAFMEWGGDTMDNSMSSSKQSSVKADTSSADYKQYAALKGEEYDRLFLANMMTHHQGAIDMANLALKSASHQDIKDLASNIVSAQTGEINDMMSWQKDWGYPASSGQMMMDHSSMGMDNTNAVMMTALEGKTGADFDKAFLEQMIMHHQSAINMATPGKSNAQHQQVKDLTVGIINAQTKEITQMKQWQKTWGYTN